MDAVDIVRLLGELGVAIGAPVLVSWVVIRGLRLAKVELGLLVQKYIVYGFSAGSVLIFTPVPLPDPTLDPGPYLGALVLLAGGVMKSAQTIYDKVWKALEGA